MSGFLLSLNSAERPQFFIGPVLQPPPLLGGVQIDPMEQAVINQRVVHQSMSSSISGSTTRVPSSVTSEIFSASISSTIPILMLRLTGPHKRRQTLKIARSFG